MNSYKKNRKEICVICDKKIFNLNAHLITHKKELAQLRKGQEKKKEESLVTVGRPLFNGKNEKDVIAKLEQAFMINCTDSEACVYAGISLDSLNRYCAKYPEFRSRKQVLKSRIVLRAKMIVFNELNRVDEKGKLTNRAWKIAWEIFKKTALVEMNKKSLQPPKQIETYISPEEEIEIRKRVRAWSDRVTAPRNYI